MCHVVHVLAYHYLVVEFFGWNDEMLDATFGSGLEVTCIGMRYELAYFVVSLYFMPDKPRAKSPVSLSNRILQKGSMHLERSTSVGFGLTQDSVLYCVHSMWLGAY